MRLWPWLLLGYWAGLIASGPHPAGILLGIVISLFFCGMANARYRSRKRLPREQPAQRRVPRWKTQMEHEAMMARRAQEMLARQNTTEIARKAAVSLGIDLDRIEITPVSAGEYSITLLDEHRSHTIPGNIRRPVMSELAKMSPDVRAHYRRRDHRAARQDVLSPDKAKLFKALTAPPPQKPCTEGGPCRPGHRRVVRTAAGYRVATVCTRCWKQTYDQDYIDHGILSK